MHTQFPEHALCRELPEARTGDVMPAAEKATDRLTRLGHPSRIWLGRDPNNLDAAGGEIDEQSIAPHEPATGPDLDGEEVRGGEPSQCVSKHSVHVVFLTRSGAGATPRSWRMVAIVPRETR
jgi:hypothetical protein